MSGGGFPQKTLPDTVSLADIGVRLRGAGADDLELLRLWKNENRAAFFDQREITPEQQAKWFSGYLTRPDDRIYLVEERGPEGWVTFGVLGVRLLERTVDIYNVMRGPSVTAGKGKLGKALTAVCGMGARTYGLPVTCKVVLDNTARSFYEHNGFELTSSEHGYHLLTWQGR